MSEPSTRAETAANLIAEGLAGLSAVASQNSPLATETREKAEAKLTQGIRAALEWLKD